MPTGPLSQVPMMMVQEFRLMKSWWKQFVATKNADTGVILFLSCD